MLAELIIPPAQPPQPIPGYHLPTDSAHLLSWDFVVEQMSNARFYWLATAQPDGRTHAAPVWGVWYHNRVHFDGSPKTRWARNLTANPQIAVHLPDAERVVIIEGRARTIAEDELNSDEWQALDSLYQRKYNVAEGSPWWVVWPQLVMAWDTAKLTTMTRWPFV